MPAPRTQKVSIPFTQGLHEGIDSRLLPLGQFSQLQNVRYTRDGRLSTRKGYVTIGNDVDTGDGTLQVYDLHTLGNRVFARGNSWGDGYPTNLYELVEHSTATWREVINDTVQTLTPFQDVKHLPLVPALISGATRSQVAACNGYLCVVYYNAFVPNFCNVQIVRAATGQVIVSALLSGALGRVCTVATGTGSNRAFVVVANDTGTNQVRAHVFDPNTNTTGAFTALGALHSADGVVRCFDVAEVVGASHFVCAVATTTTNQVRVFRYNLSGVQQGGTITQAATNLLSVAVEADAAASSLSTFGLESGGTFRLTTYTFAGAVVAGTTLFGGEVALVTADDQVRICRLPANSRSGQGARVVCLANVRGALNSSASGPLQTADVMLDIRSTAAHAALTNGWTRYRDMVLEGHVIALPQVASPGARNAFVFSASIGESVSRTGFKTNVLVYSDGNVVEHQAPIRERITLTAEGSASYDASTGRVHWSSFAQTTDQETRKVPVYTSCLVNSTQRVSSAELAGVLFMAGAVIQGFDGFMPKEVGWIGIPGIRHTANFTGGGAPLNTTGSYDFVITWSWVNSKGDLERSAPSEPVTVTMSAGSNNTVLQVSTPRSLVQLMGSGTITGVSVEVWRTVWDSANGVKLTGFRKDSVNATLAGIADLGGTVNVGPVLTDTALASQELLYTDAGSGALSGSLPRVNAPAAAFLSVVGNRLQLAGMADRARYCESMSKIPGRALCFPPNALRGVGYYNEAAADIIGAASTDAGRLLFTEKDIYIAPGPGATEDGQGQIPSGLGVGTDLPLRNTALAGRTLLRAKDGVWYQADDEKLCVMPLGGGLPEWKGQEIRFTMQSSTPNIIGAAQCLADNSLYFLANNATTVNRMFVRDQRVGVWCVDALPGAGTAVRTLATHNGVPIFVRNNGTIYRMSAAYADTVSSPIVSAWQTGFAQMGGLGGWQEIVSIVVKIRWLADCGLSLFIALDGGAATLIRTQSLTGLSVGSVHSVLFVPKRRKCNQFSLIGGITPTLATEGADILGIELELLPQAGPVRLPRTRRGS